MAPSLSKHHTHIERGITSNMLKVVVEEQMISRLSCDAGRYCSGIMRLVRGLQLTAAMSASTE